MEAMEDAGLRRDQLDGSRTSVFIGSFMYDYLCIQSASEHRDEINPYVAMGTCMTSLSNRISYDWANQRIKPIDWWHKRSESATQEVFAYPRLGPGQVWDAAATFPNVKLHLYGKTEARPGRKMGHLTALAPTPEEAARDVLAARNALTPVL